MARIQRLLIANRGEIACRIARSARALGMEVIAVYSDADAGAAHVRGADRALRLGPAPARASYLDVAALMACARAAGADAIHPGYGFLSESAALAAACGSEGRVFVGPPLQALQVMGSKAEAKRRMALAHVPLTPGYHGEDQSLEVMRAQAEALGYPLLVKASAGGGGRGMRRVDGPDGLAPALAACRREALGAFGDGRLLLERLLVPARHIEVQVFGDAHGALVHLFDRDCSLQRRHQKVIEEAPAPQLAPALRARMAGAALAAARAVGYVGAGTVEFLLPVRAGPEAPEFCFMEMNTRLQVEHTVTEAITGLDLVEWQLRVAQGEPLPLEQAQIQASGHAFQARLYAEDPARGFLPSPGVLQELQVPDGEGLRWDGGFEAGDRIAGEYDALLGKLVAWGPDRESARARLGQALARLQVSGPVTNHALLARLLDHPLVRQPAGADTGLLDRELEPLCAPDDDERDAHRIALLVEYLLAAGTVERACPWADGNGWRLNQAAGRRMGRAPAPLAPAQAPVWIGPAPGPDRGVLLVGAARGGPGWQARWLDPEPVRTALLGAAGHGRWTWALPGAPGAPERIVQARVACGPAGRTVWVNGRCHAPAQAGVDGTGEDGDPASAQDALCAPLPGRVIALLAEPGALLDAGAPLLALEAMKMEHVLRAPGRGRLDAFLARVGDAVERGARLVEFVLLAEDEQEACGQEACGQEACGQEARETKESE